MKLLREFFVIFLGNSLLVLVAWRIYGARIRNKFMTVSGSVKKSISSPCHHLCKAQCVESCMFEKRILV